MKRAYIDPVGPCVLIGVLLCVMPAMIGMGVAYHVGYSNGQIDALDGKQKYMRVQNTLLVKIKDGK